MAITIKSFPSANIQGNASNKSYWVAVHHPVVWTFQRKDFAIIDVTDAGSGNSIIHLSAPAIAEAVVGDFIYLETDNYAAGGSGSVGGTFEITEINLSFNWVKIVNTMSTTNTNGWINYVSARKGHRIETIVYSLDNSFTLTPIGTMVSVCSPSGIANANIMEYLKSLVDYKENFTFDTVIAEDTTLGGKYTIGYTEKYNTTSISYGSVDYLGDHNYVNASKQIQDVYGSNMAEYVPSLIYEDAKFMSDFITPTYFSELPFALTFILSDKICHVFNSEYFGIDNLRKVEIYFDVNGNAISAINPDIYDSTSAENVNRLMLGNSIPANASYTLVSIAYDDGVIIDHRLIELKKVKINSSCQYKNPVYLNWLGTNGGRNFWLFDISQSDILEVTDTGEFVPQTVDLAIDLGNGNYIGKDASPQLVCFAYLEVSDLQGLKGLLMSPDVLMLTNPETWQTDNDTSPPSPLPKWKRVKVLPQTYKVLETNGTHAEIEITLILPTVNIQQQ